MHESNRNQFSFYLWLFACSVIISIDHVISMAVASEITVNIQNASL